VRILITYKTPFGYIHPGFKKWHSWFSGILLPLKMGMVAVLVKGFGRLGCGGVEVHCMH
jgi:hypothetical protein